MILSKQVWDAINPVYKYSITTSLTDSNESEGAGELFILDVDAHTIIDRKGSVNEASD